MAGLVRSIILLLMLSLSYATAIDVVSGDAGKEFATATVAEKCKENDVQAVYTCIGNVVKVVSSVPGKGSVFYKPDGKVVACPIVLPSEMGAECVQLMTPNYCPSQAECGTSNPSEFPGQTGSPEQTGDSDYYIVIGQAATEASKDAVVVEVLKPKPKVTPAPAAKPGNLEIPAMSGTNNIDGPIGYVAYIVAFLGLVSVGVLFLLFKNSIGEEAEE